MTNFNSELYKAWERFYETEDAKNPDESPYAKFDWDMGKNFISTLEMFKGFIISQGLKCEVERKAIAGMDIFWTVAGLCVNVSKGVFDTFELHHAGAGSADLITVHKNSEWVKETQAAAEAAEKQEEANRLWDEWVAYRNKNRRNPDFIGVFGFSETTCFAQFAENNGFEAGYAKLNGQYGLPHWIFCPQSGDVNPNKYHIAFCQKGKYESKWYLMSQKLGEIFGLSDGKIIRV